MINQDLKNSLFREFEKEEFYKRHFQRGSRFDGRALHQIRPTQLSINTLAIASPDQLINNNNSNSSVGNCICKKGETVVLCEVRGAFRQLATNPLTNTYSQQLITISVALPESKQVSNHDRQRREAYLADFLKDCVKRMAIQKQLTAGEGRSTYGCVLVVNVRVLSDAGGLLSSTCMATQIALLCSRIPRVQVQPASKKLVLSGGIQHLVAQQAYLGLEVAEINGQILLDPTQDEEADSQYRVTLLADILDDGCRVIKAPGSEVQFEVLQSLTKLARSETTISKLDIRLLQERSAKTKFEYLIQSKE